MQMDVIRTDTVAFARLVPINIVCTKPCHEHRFEMQMGILSPDGTVSVRTCLMPPLDDDVDVTHALEWMETMFPTQDRSWVCVCDDGRVFPSRYISPHVWSSNDPAFPAISCRGRSGEGLVPMDSDEERPLSDTSPPVQRRSPCSPPVTPRRQRVQRPASKRAFFCVNSVSIAAIVVAYVFFCVWVMY